MDQSVYALFTQGIATNTPSSIQLYLSALCFFQIWGGGPDPSLADFLQLHYVVRAVQCFNPIHCRPSRLPITPAILRHLYNAWSTPPVCYTHHMFWAACSLGFFCFLRAGEFTCSSTHAYDPSVLAPGDIRVDDHSNPKYLSVTLHHSKTNMFGSGFTLFVGSTGYLCPVTATLSYLAMHPSLCGPLFVHKDGEPLPRTDLVVEVRQALASLAVDVSKFSGHSFQIGAATTAAPSWHF